MAHPSPPPPIYEDPPTSPQDSTHSTSQSTSTASTHTSSSLPLLIQHQISPPTFGHAFIDLPTSPPPTLPLLTNTAIRALRETPNPNNSTVIPGTASVECLLVHWGVRPAQLGSTSMVFPCTTQLYEGNLETVLAYMRRGGGYDFVEVRFKESRADLAMRSGTVVSSAKVGSGRSLVDGKGKGKEQGGKSAGRGDGGVPLILDYSS